MCFHVVENNYLLQLCVEEFLLYSPHGDFEHNIIGYVNAIFTAYKFI